MSEQIRVIDHSFVRGGYNIIDSGVPVEQLRRHLEDHRVTDTDLSVQTDYFPLFGNIWGDVVACMQLDTGSNNFRNFGSAQNCDDTRRKWEAAVAEVTKNRKLVIAFEGLSPHVDCDGKQIKQVIIVRNAPLT